MAIQKTYFIGMPVYCELPKLYESTDGSDVVLKLNKSLYGLVQALLCWYKHLRDGLIAKGFMPSELDTCLYFGHEWLC